MESYSDSVVKPRFKVTDNAISVTLPILKYVVEVTSDEKKIINCLDDGAQLSSGEISKITGFNKSN